MAYATQDDLLQRMSMAELTQLTDDARLGVPNATVVQGALDEASAKVESYVRNRYVTPLQASITATAITRDIATYLLFSRRPQQMSETVRQRFEDAIAELNAISTGKAALDQPVAAAAPQSVSSVGVLPTTSNLRFTDDNIQGFV